VLSLAIVARSFAMLSSSVVAGSFAMLSSAVAESLTPVVPDGGRQERLCFGDGVIFRKSNQ
jgi:hypothetical protein